MKPPKLKKLPEPPKNKTVAAMRRYVERLNEVQEENAERWAPYQEYLDELEGLEKEAAKLRAKFADPKSLAETKQREKTLMDDLKKLGKKVKKAVR